MEMFSFSRLTGLLKDLEFMFFLLFEVFLSEKQIVFQSVLIDLEMLCIFILQVILRIRFLVLNINQRVEISTYSLFH